MARLGIVYDERFKDHTTQHGHPERPARMDAVRAALEWSGVLSGPQIAATPIDEALLRLVHTDDYLARLHQACVDGQPFIDTPDSEICPRSEEIARLAVGGVVNAARAIGAGEIDRAFCAVRPPGHHAEADRSMGFCFYANVVLAAKVWQRECGIERVAILDWDVHHGNGTQHLLEDDPSVLFISLHGHPEYLYPGTGYAHEVGLGAGRGFTLNVPLLPQTDDAALQAAFAEQVMPKLREFAPEGMIVSCGFDAHEHDPVGNLALTDAAYVWMLRQVKQIAGESASGRILSVLEGGYNLEVLRRCVAEHVQELESDR